MRRSLLRLAAAWFVALWLPAQAAAQGGGLYEPFPDPGSPEQVRDFLEDSGSGRLAAELDRADIERGHSVPGSGLDTRGARRASTRAGVTDAPGLLDGWPWALAAFGLAGAVWVGVARSRA